MAYNKDFVISFVRHAQSLGNVGQRYEDEYHPDDPPLSPHGLLQAEALGKSAITDNVDSIYSSPLIRAVQTAYPTAERLNKDIILLPDLMENDTRISGTELFRLKNHYPLAVPCVTEPTPTGGKLLLGEENAVERALRGKRCMDFFFDKAKEGQHIMVVTHGSFFGNLIRAALEIELPESFCWQVDNCCITRVIFRKDNIPKLSVANYVGHLSSTGDEIPKI